VLKKKKVSIQEVIRMLHPFSVGKKAVFIFLLLFLLFSLATAAHHHADGKCHDHDCSICAAGSLVFSVPSSPFLAKLQCASTGLCTYFNDVFVVRTILSEAHANRAPPALSHS
jgi:hypothetical protein